MTATGAAKDVHDVDTRYLQGILVSFLVMSATLFLYTTLNDPVLEVKKSDEPVHFPLQQRSRATFPRHRLRLHELDVVPVQLVHAVEENSETRLVAKMFPDPDLLQEDTKRRNHVSSSVARQDESDALWITPHKSHRRKLATPSLWSGQHNVHHDGYKLVDLQEGQAQLVNQLFMAAGYLVAAIFVGAVLVKAVIDGDWEKGLICRENREPKDCSASCLPENRRLLNYGSFGSSDRVSDWSGDYFDRYDV